jgi:hypothetical protein
MLRVSLQEIYSVFHIHYSDMIAKFTVRWYVIYEAYTRYKIFQSRINATVCNHSKRSPIACDNNVQALMLFTSCVSSHRPFQSYMLSNDITRHAQAVCRKPFPLYSILHFIYSH